MNRNGWLRIVEASIAVLIVLGVLIAVSMGGKTRTSEKDYTQFINKLLEEMAQNASIRDVIWSITLSDNPYTIPDTSTIIEHSKVIEFIKKRLPDKSLNFQVNVCKPDKVCPLEPYPSSNQVPYEGDIYSADRVFAPQPDKDFETRRVRIYIWKK